MSNALSRVAKLIIIALLLPQAAFAADDETFSCDVFGSGYTPHPDFQYVCCYPGTVPVPGEQRCVAPGDETTPQLRPVPLIDQGTGEQCIATGQICVLHGTACCSGTCSGSFPNTYCQ